MTGRLGDRTLEMNGRSAALYLARALCVPVFLLILILEGWKQGCFQTSSGDVGSRPLFRGAILSLLFVNENCFFCLGVGPTASSKISPTIA